MVNNLQVSILIFLKNLKLLSNLERLNVDIIEAGFPAASKGDFNSVKEIAQTIKNCSVTGLGTLYSKGY